MPGRSASCLYELVREDKHVKRCGKRLTRTRLRFLAMSTSGSLFDFTVPRWLLVAQYSPSLSSSFSVPMYAREDPDAPRPGPSPQRRVLESPQWSDFLSTGDFSFLGNVGQRRLIEASHESFKTSANWRAFRPCYPFQNRRFQLLRGSPWVLAAERPPPRLGPISAGVIERSASQSKRGAHALNALNTAQ